MLRNGRWVPTFPKAKYIFHKGEYAHWEAMTKQGANPPGNVWTYNCRPIVEAGQALLVDDTYQLDDTFSLTPTPGHSPHHCCVDIRSKGQHAVVTGDMMHHALQCREPSWSTIFDYRQGAGRKVAARLPRQGGRYQHARAADPFPQPDRRPSGGGRRALPLQLRALSVCRRMHRCHPGACHRDPSAGSGAPRIAGYRGPRPSSVQSSASAAARPSPLGGEDVRP